MTIFELEQTNLQKIQTQYKDLRAKYEKLIQRVIKEYKNDPFLQANLLEQFSTKISQINKHLQDPFFGRIDFTNLTDSKKQKDICYIGKVGIIDETGKIITVDWRAPIASLYYDSNVGLAEYNSPSGIIKGKLELKRQFEIENGKLKSYQDVNTISNDEFLKPYLNVNADNRLKNIVSTIQSEQNYIIRRPLNENMIVQGTAGSGKTTVALHRIAYLIYNEQKNYKENQFLVIGPNAYFMDYISSVLPDLDVNTVTQYTFLDIVNNYLDDKIKIIDQNNRLEDFLKGYEQEEIIKFKSSLKFKDAICQFVTDIEKNIIHGPLIFKGIKLIDEKIIESFLNKNNLGINERIKEFNKYCRKYIKDNNDEIKNRYWLKFRDEYLSLKEDDLRRQEILKETEAFNQEIFKIDKIVNEYFKEVNLKPLELYKLFIQNCEKYLNKDDCNIELLKKITLEAIGKRKLGYEDLPSLMYLNLLFNGYKNYDSFIHVVIDEAQDFGLFHFFVFKKLFKNSTFSIFGDLAQSIYSYQSINNWDEVQDLFVNDCKFLKLEKSYRTTYEIMESANLILKTLGYVLGKAVLRHGTPVKVFHITKNNIVNYISDKINMLKKDLKSIAIICKDEEKTIGLARCLSDIKNINIITSKNTKYDGGICLVPSYLAKGLEFDAVIIYNVDDYDCNNEIDMKLLYVAMTRALHILEITYQNTLMEPLKTLLEDGDEDKRI